MNSDLFVDPAIINLSQAPARPGLSQKKSALEPGSALSKLLDSAMANAAKEKSPDDFDKPASESLLPVVGLVPLAKVGNDDWMLTLIPECKINREKIYSIESLLTLQNDPNVSLYDASQLPPQSFWFIKTKHTTDTNRGNAGNSKRNRRSNNNTHANTHAYSGQDSGRSWDHGSSKVNWDRRPAGFLKQSELETMSRDKILKLLGENPNEVAPEWDSPLNNGSGSNINMGSTVEEFERWKQEMRNEDRRRNGEDVHESLDGAETIKGNEVDNFFSFVSTSNEKPPRGNSGSVTDSHRAIAKDSSKFSTFFGAPPLTQRSSIESDSPRANTSDRSNQNPSVTSSGRSLKFFTNDTSANPSAPVKTSSQELPAQANIPSSGTKPPSNDLGSQFSRYSTEAAPPGIPLSGNALPPLGYPGLSRNPPPGMALPQGMAPPPGLNKPPGGSNDNFFFSLLHRRGDEPPRTENQVPSLQEVPQSGSKDDNRQLPNGAFPPSYPTGVPPNHPLFGLPPPGMFPPGMTPSGQMGPPQSRIHPGQNGQETGNIHIPGGPNSFNASSGKPGQSVQFQHLQQGQGQQIPQGLQNQQMGAMPSDIPPWKRVQPGPNGQMPPPPSHFAYPQMGPGFPPGMAAKPEYS